MDTTPPAGAALATSLVRHHVLLNNALKQTDWPGKFLTAENWREIVRSKIESISLEQALADVQPFLASQQEIEFVKKENLLRLLQ